MESPPFAQEEQTEEVDGQIRRSEQSSGQVSDSFSGTGDLWRNLPFFATAAPPPRKGKEGGPQGPAEGVSEAPGTPRKATSNSLPSSIAQQANPLP